MYETTCPSCGHVTKASFIRVGAVVVCEGCGQRFQVQPGKIARKVQASEAALAEIAESLSASVRASSAEATEGARAKAAAPDWTPPSDAPRKPAPTPAPAPASAPPRRAAAATAAPAPAAPPAAPPPAPAPARRRKRARMSWSTIYALGASLLVTGVLIIALVVAAMDDGSKRRGVGASGGQDGPEGLGPQAIDVPMLTAEAFAPAAWREVDEAATTLSPVPGPVNLTQEKWVRPAGATDQLLYTAQAVADGADVIALAWVQLSMIDDEGRVFARASAPLLHANQRAAVPVTVVTPLALRRRMAFLVWESKVEQLWPGAVLIEDAAIHSYGTGKRTLVRVKAFNPLAAPMKDATFVIGATDYDGRPLGQWRVRYSEPLGPRRSVEFTVLVPLTGDEVAVQWTVAGAGTPAPNP